MLCFLSFEILLTIDGKYFNSGNEFFFTALLFRKSETYSAICYKQKYPLSWGKNALLLDFLNFVCLPQHFNFAFVTSILYFSSIQQPKSYFSG